MAIPRSLAPAAVLAALLVAGCSSGDATASVSAPSASPSSTLPPSLVAACDRNQKVQQEANGDLTGYGDDISQIYQDAPVDVPTVHQAAQDLHDAWAVASTNKGQFSATATLFGASLRLETACIYAGWKQP